MDLPLTQIPTCNLNTGIFTDNNFLYTQCDKIRPAARPNFSAKSGVIDPHFRENHRHQCVRYDRAFNHHIYINLNISAIGQFTA
ncbi:hypothetical protein [Photobacterium profundum]|uniref:hypothetical protein n=1 Tax=Photobacterium profundum TaxID=74109 RepID=UPI003D0BB936